MADQRAPDHYEPPGSQSIEATLVRRTWLVAVAILLFLVLIWLIDLEDRLPDARAPRDFRSSQLSPGSEIVPPGYHPIDELDATLSGDWLEQEIGNADWLATDQQGSQLRAVFYGTELHLVARVGPEAGYAYVRVDGNPVDSLFHDEQGSFSDLWAAEATDESILLVSGLAHGEHLVEITAGGEGEVAISGLEVVAETPFPWAFLLAYLGVGGGIFVLVRKALFAVTGSRTGDSRGEDREVADASL